jgi:hypothetical protein
MQGISAGSFVQPLAALHNLSNNGSMGVEPYPHQTSDSIKLNECGK